MSLASSIIAGFVAGSPEHVGMRSVTRRAAPTFVDGRAVPGSTTTVQVLAAILPHGSKRAQRDPEGERVVGEIDIYSADPLYPPRDTGEPADRLEWDGATWEVDSCDTFPGGLYQATARRVRTG